MLDEILMKQKRYIGITGFTTPDQIREINQFWQQIKPENTILMIGILVSPKTFKHELTNPRYPQEEDLKKMIKECHPFHPLNNLILFHYNTRTQAFAEEVCQLFRDYNIDGVQLNISHPDLDEINEIKAKYPMKKIVFQANNSVLNQLESYKYLHEIAIDYVLIDPSGGRGSLITQAAINEILPYLPEDIRIGLAGGFMPENIHEWAIQFPDYCFDIESGVRTKDILDIEKAKQYLKNCII
jgi:phosphoribosylanthranilate isomerase